MILFEKTPLRYGNAANQCFTYLTPDFNLSVFGLPIRVGGNLVLENQNWRRDLSTYTFQLDYEALLAQKKQQLKDLALQEKMKSWSKEELERSSKRFHFWLHNKNNKLPTTSPTKEIRIRNPTPRLYRCSKTSE